MAQRRKKTWGETYAAQVVVSYTSLGPVNHLKVRRHDGGINHLTWDELMVIKNEMLGEDACAIELFPHEGDTSPVCVDWATALFEAAQMRPQTRPN